MKKNYKNTHNSDSPLFSYKIGKSFMHRMPTLAKLLLLFAIPISIFLLPITIALLFSIAGFVVSLILGSGIKEQYRDVKPILVYCIFLLMLYILNILFSSPTNGEYLFTLGVKLIASMQWTTLFFKTTSSLSLQHALESFLPSDIAKIFSLFINFIPMLFSVWNKLDTSWKARGGKNGLSKVLALLPVFISVSLHKAYNVSVTIENRS